VREKKEKRRKKNNGEVKRKNKRIKIT